MFSHLQRFFKVVLLDDVTFLYFFQQLIIFNSFFFFCCVYKAIERRNEANVIQYTCVSL